MSSAQRKTNSPRKNAKNAKKGKKTGARKLNPLLSGIFQLNPAYDSGDGLHPNDAGHLLIGTIIRTNLP
jgi:hypothetical protein